jgi:membrane-bound serine protease (ClpP class)
MLLSAANIQDIYAQDEEQIKTEISNFNICQIDGIIDPTVSNYIIKCLDRSALESSGLIISIDTPGGLETSMREICNSIVNSPIPVISFVNPEGARAASAGVFIVYASDIAVMSPSTSIGAAHPVTITGQQEEIDEVMMEKVLKDSVSYIKNLAAGSGRNPDWAEKAITESASITSDEALDLNVIDLIATDTDELLKELNGTVIDKNNMSFVLSTDNYTTENINMNFLSKFLHIITNPNIAYVLFILGIFGIIYEFAQPGLGVSGAIGVICIILALYAFSVIPINYAGLALIILAIILFILDLKLNTGGMVSIAGIASLLIGSFILINSEAPYLQIARSLVIGLSLAVSVFLILVIRAVYRAQRQKPVTGDIGLVGTVGKVIENLNPSGLIKIHGEIWKAVSDDKKTVKKGSNVEILKVEGLLLYVKKVKDR